jgi:predicted deacetylase
LEDVLRAENFRYTCRIGSLTHLQTGRTDLAWAGTYSLRSAWRRGLARLWHPLWKSIWARREIVRLSLHPVDLEVPFVRRQVGLLLEELARQGYRSHSYAEHVEM